MMLTEESDYYDLFNEEEKNEFLFRLFKHFCIGGQVCQYEDDLQPYLDMTKGLYKDLIRYYEKRIFVLNSFKRNFYSLKRCKRFRNQRTKNSICSVQSFSICKYIRFYYSQDSKNFLF